MNTKAKRLLEAVERIETLLPEGTLRRYITSQLTLYISRSINSETEKKLYKTYIKYAEIASHLFKRKEEIIKRLDKARVTANKKERAKLKTIKTTLITLFQEDTDLQRLNHLIMTSLLGLEVIEQNINKRNNIN